MRLACPKIAVNAVVGPPDRLGNQLLREIAAALRRQHHTVVAGEDEPADFRLDLYILAATGKGQTTVSYVLDIKDDRDTRLRRFEGREVASGRFRDPWGTVTPALTRKIAAKATSSISTWLRAGRRYGAVKDSRPYAGLLLAPESTSNFLVPSARKLEPMVFVGPVVGAPGDGGSSLRHAIRGQLVARRVTVSNYSSISYRIDSFVTMTGELKGEQLVFIEWLITDPQGDRLGTVYQRNNVPKGSLDDRWGLVADQAAEAAVRGIITLLPPQSARNRDPCGR
jgi:hypothetical protein